MSHEEKICRIQGMLLGMGIGMTRVIYDRAVTRWADDAFEVDTWGQPGLMDSRWAAEEIARGA
jgi:hypothetical protein